jgi:transcriptional regulator with XRE-family HTH domain
MTTALAFTRQSDTGRRHPRSPSIDILRRALELRGITRKAFVQSTGLSYEYVSRIFNSKVRFPMVRETLERFAEVAGVDPMLFPEYQQLVSALPESTRMLWDRMQELGLSRQEFANRVEISRTYLYEILRGDVPFPRNPEIIETLSRALELPPETFTEYLAPVEDWANRNPQAIESVFMNMLVAKMLHARGYWQGEAPTALSDSMLSIFPADARFAPGVRELFREMGSRRLGVTALATMAGVAQSELRLILLGQVDPEDLTETYHRVRQVLGLR